MYVPKKHALSCLYVVLSQACESRPIGADCFLGAGLKETGVKMESLDRGLNRGAAATDGIRKCVEPVKEVKTSIDIKSAFCFLPNK